MKQKLLTLLTALIFMNSGAWGETATPTGSVHQPGSITGDNLLTYNGKKYEIFWCNSTSGNVLTAMTVKAYASSTTETIGSAKWCVAGSSVQSTSASISNAGSIDEFSFGKQSYRYWRVRASNQSNYQIVMIVKGYNGVAALHKAGSDFQIIVEKYNVSTEKYESYTPAKTSLSSATQSQYKSYASLDASEQFRITFQGSGTGTTNRDVLAFSLEIPTITISSATWATFSMSSEVMIPVGVTAYYANKKDESTITLKEITSGIIPANEGVVLHGSEGSTILTLSSTNATNIDGNLMKPNVTAKTLSSTYYTLAVDGDKNPIFKQSTGVGELAAGKAYLDLSGLSAHELKVDFENNDNVTGIHNIMSKVETKAEYYNLAGQRVAQPIKGLYIVNGRKVIIK